MCGLSYQASLNTQWFHTISTYTERIVTTFRPQFRKCTVFTKRKLLSINQNRGLIPMLDQPKSSTSLTWYLAISHVTVLHQGHSPPQLTLQYNIQRHSSFICISSTPNGVCHDILKLSNETYKSLS